MIFKLAFLIYLLCHCSSGLNTLYQGEAELNKLLKLVLTEGKNSSLNINDSCLVVVVDMSYMVGFLCVQVKETVVCLNFGMSSLLTWQTSCRKIDLGVKKTTTTGKWQQCAINVLF